MGLFCANLHFRTTDDHALSAALDRRGVAQYRVVPAANGWTTLYEEQASQQDDEWIRELAGGLSQDLNAPAIAFLVHDSDIACYWLFDNGQLLDQYNSCPDYFDDVATEESAAGPSGGQPDVLVRYCQAGVGKQALREILSQETVFAESVIEGLAEALGIDPKRALADYRDTDAWAGDEEADSGPSFLAGRKGLAGQLAALLGTPAQGVAADPQVTALVQAAERDDTDEIERLLAEGVAVDAEAPTQLPGAQPLAGLGQLFPGGPPAFPMTPLLAAVANKRHRAAEQLLQAGADPNRMHPFFGTPIHAATGAGEVQLLQLLLDHGGDVNARNPQGQTLLQVIEAGRATRERLAQAQAMMQSMGLKLPGLVEQLSNVQLPEEGWDACEQLLRAHGERGM